MVPTLEKPETLFFESKKGYLKFVQLFLTMQISFLQNISLHSNCQNEQKDGEQELLDSLILLEKIIMNVHIRDLWLKRKKLLCTKELNEEINNIKHLLRKLEVAVLKHRFIDERNKDQLIKLIEYLTKYFNLNNIEVLIMDAHGEPLIQPFAQYKKGV